MATIYEVWDDDSGNRVGGPFATQAEAEILLNDVVRVTGDAAVRSMAIIAWAANVDGGLSATPVMEGSAVLVHIQEAVNGTGSADPNTVSRARSVVEPAR